jgi:hypothetical protein
VISRPAAILLQRSSRPDPVYARLVERLRLQMKQGGIPVIDVEDTPCRIGAPVDLTSRIGPYVVNEAEL